MDSGNGSQLAKVRASVGFFPFFFIFFFLLLSLVNKKVAKGSSPIFVPSPPSLSPHGTPSFFFSFLFAKHKSASSIGDLDGILMQDDFLFFDPHGLFVPDSFPLLSFFFSFDVENKVVIKSGMSGPPLLFPLSQ